MKDYSTIQASGTLISESELRTDKTVLALEAHSAAANRLRSMRASRIRPGDANVCLFENALMQLAVEADLESVLVETKAPS
eukprot:6481484-Amphidinium_carterae.1